MKTFLPFRFLAALAAAAIASSAAAAERKELAFSFSFPEKTLSFVGREDGTELPVLDGTALPSGNPGKPWLPVQAASVKLPVGWKAVGIAAAADLRLVREGIDLAPEQAPHPTSERNLAPTPKDPAAYASADPWPEERAELTGSHVMRGFPFATILVKPLAYAAARKELFLAETVKVVLTIERDEPAAAKGVAAAAAAFRPGDPSGRFQSRLNAMVVNPFTEPDASAKPSAKASAKGEGGGVGTCTYLLVTGEALADAFRPLAEFRRRYDGVTAEIVTVEEIAADYDGTRPDGGSDVQTKIRNCIKDYVENRGTEYVCLGGDDTVVPDRDCYVYVDSDSWYDDMPTDLYYSGLDGTWDANADGVYGKASGDDCDLAPDVVVCRIPVRTAEQASGYLRKLFAYERNAAADPERLFKFYLGGEVAWSYAWSTNAYWPRETEIPTFDDGLPSFSGRTTRVSDAELWGRRVWRDFFSKEEYGFKPSFFYDTITSWDSATEGDYPQNAANVVKRMSEGYHYLYYDAHGSPSGWSLESGRFDTSSASQLTGPVDFVYTCACLSGHFDGDDEEPSLSEAMIRNPDGATVGWLGCSREGWGQSLSGSRPDDYGGSTASADFGISFYDQILVEGVPRFGDAVCWGKAQGIAWCGQPVSRWLMYGLNGQGDPMARLYQPHLAFAPRLATPTVALSGSAASFAVDVLSVGDCASFADVWFEVSFDDPSFAAPSVVPAGRLEGPGAAEATLADVPAGARAVYVRARALSDFGRGAVSDIAASGTDGDSFPGALDAPDRVFANASASPWTVVLDPAAVCGSCVRSGEIGNSASTAFSTVVTGPGKVSFRWKVSSEANYDKLAFYVGSTAMADISGEKDWARVEFDVPSGEQTLSWEYKKDSSMSKGEDAAWVDVFAFGPILPEVRVERVGAVSDDGSGTVRATATSLAGASSGELRLERSDSLSFEGSESVSLGTVAEGESREKTWTGLAPGSTHYVRAKLVAGGKTSVSGITCLVVPGPRPGTCILSGTVRGRNGKPAETLQVVASPGGRSATVGADGTYSLVLASGWAGSVSIPGVAGAWPAQATLSTGDAAAATQDFVVDHVLRVRAGAAGIGDGSSWDDAIPSLSEALARCADEATLGSGSTWREIWVAAGTYVPGTSSNSVFATPLGIEVYGGFAGTETGRSQRDWIANPTVLSGEIGDPDRTDDNVKTLVTGPVDPGPALWDGFVFTGARESAVKALFTSESEAVSSGCLVVDHSLFTGNRSSGTYKPAVAYGPLYLRNCVVTGNSYDYSYEFSGIFRLVNLDNCTVFGNTTAGGPVAYAGSFRNTVFWGNTVSGVGYHVGHNSYHANDSSSPFEGYGTTVWICPSPKVSIGTVHKTDPGFVADPATGLACALGADSFAVDKGRTISWMAEDSLDYFGNPRACGSAPDLGAFEFVPSGTATAPRFASETVDAVTLDSVTVSATLRSLGAGSSWADLVAQVAATPDFETVLASAAAVRVGAAGVRCTASVSGLAAGAARYVRFVATGSGGLSAAGDALFFATPDCGTPSGSFSLGAPKTRTIPVSWRLDGIGDGNDSATLHLDYGTTPDYGRTKTLGTFSSARDGSAVLDGLDPATAYRIRLRIVASPSGRVFLSDPATATTPDVVREEKGWFFVDLSDPGYAGFPDVSGVIAPGGSWSGAAAFGVSYSSATQTLSLALAEGADESSELLYSPTAPSAAGCDAEVRGAVVATPHRSLAALPVSADALAGLAFVRGASGLTPCGYAGGVWTVLSPAVAPGTEVAWRALFDFSSPAKPRVRYVVGATTNGWLALASGTQLAAVGFRGDQTLGSFRGTWWKVVEAFEIVRPSFEGGAHAPVYDPATGAFAVRVGGIVEGWHYTVFSAPSLDGEFRAVEDSREADAALAASGFDVVCPPKGDGSSLFVKIVASDLPFEENDPFPQDAQ